MRKLINNDLLTLVFRFLLGGVFIYASIYKIADPSSFALSIWYYHMVPGGIINLMALILPWMELLCGLALIAGIWYRGAIFWVTIMLVIFIAALTSAVSRGLSIDCGCFKQGGAGTSAAWRSLLLDIGLFVVAMQLWLSRSTRWMLSRH